MSDEELKSQYDRHVALAEELFERDEIRTAYGDLLFTLTTSRDANLFVFTLKDHEVQCRVLVLHASDRRKMLMAQGVFEDDGRQLWRSLSELERMHFGVSVKTLDDGQKTMTLSALNPDVLEDDEVDYVPVMYLQTDDSGATAAVARFRDGDRDAMILSGYVAFAKGLRPQVEYLYLDGRTMDDEDVSERVTVTCN